MTSLLQSLHNEVVTELGAGAVAQHYYAAKGAQEINKFRAPPAVIWTRGGAEFEAAQRDGWDNPRQLWLKRQAVEIHIWGTTEEQADTLLENEIAALHRQTNTSWAIVSEAPGAINEAWLALGFALVVQVKFDVPMHDEIQTVGQATDYEFEHTSTPGDGWLESGEG